MNYFCCTDARRSAVLEHAELNGIDFLEVLDDQSDPFEERQTTLFVHFLKPLSQGDLQSQNFQIKGGERITNIQIVEVTLLSLAVFPASPPEGADKTLVVKVKEAGDFSIYTLCLVQDAQHAEVPAGFDPILSSVDFSFKVACPNDFDCKTETVCLTEETPLPEISYLAKDYESFRQLMLDRMSLLMPQWTERNPADMGITLVELLAYTADYLSYRQDAIATEAYLNTARKRVSVRRHARLIDYFMHDGSNARTWIHLDVNSDLDGTILAAEVDGVRSKVLSRTENLAPALKTNSKAYEEAVQKDVKVFELMHDLQLYSAHNEMYFYTWGEENCCLPKGATSATLLGEFPDLKIGDILIFCEKVGPENGVEADADPARRHAIRLTHVSIVRDPLFEPPPSSPPLSPPEAGLAVTNIEWDDADRLPFPFCISSTTEDGPIENVTVVLGNNVMADHGITIIDEGESSLNPELVPGSTLNYVENSKSTQAFCESAKKDPIPGRYNPYLGSAPLTQAAPFDFLTLESAIAAMNSGHQSAVPSIRLTQIDTEGEESEWIPQRDLLNSSFNSKEFVVEIDENGMAVLRFGDGKQGEKPAAGSSFKAIYRIGNGLEGNIGAEVLNHLVVKDDVSTTGLPDGIVAVSNPIPAAGGREAESMEEVRQYAPEAFRTQARAVTAADYETFARKCNPDIQRAAATFRWTGSWKTVFLTIDRFDGDHIDAEFETDLRNCLEKYRMAGFDLEVDLPRFVSLDIEMKVCVQRNFFASDVKKELLELFSNRALNNGRKGVFHPDNFSFGQTVYLSQLYAAAQSVQGVDFVRITKFQRQGVDDEIPMEDGKLELGRREIARCDNDPNFAERGVFNLIVEGGR